jgi:Protein of unknown function DUF262
MESLGKGSNVRPVEVHQAIDLAAVGVQGVLMGYQLPVTIGETIKRLQSHDLVLPAIQREFIWKDHQIETLFDSLMRGYPIGSFLSWAVQKETAKKFRFYDFIKDYHEWTNPHCKVLDLANEEGASAILDGQQRLTALNVGLRGSFADRTSGAWRYKAASYPVRRLYLNVMKLADENEDGRVYDFRFLSDAKRKTFEDEPEIHWFPVNLCYDLEIDDLVGEVADAIEPRPSPRRTARQHRGAAWAGHQFLAMPVGRGVGSLALDLIGNQPL